MSGHDSDWWRGAVIYQIYPRSFFDANGDGVGDLPGVIAKLPYVADLGVDAIWISPFFRSPMKDFGYDVSDYRDVDPIFGKLADFDRLIKRAHQLGIKIMIDQVLSHTSDQHAWFVESRASRDNPRADWYVWADARPDGTPPNNWLSVFGGSAWTWDSRRRQYYYHQFLASQPDLNFHAAAVQDQLLEEVGFWCQRGVDGFRFDACNHQVHDARLRNNPAASAGKVATVRADNPYAMQKHRYDKSQPENLLFLERLREVLDRHGAAAVGEIGDDNGPAIMAAYTEAGKRLHMAYSFSLLTPDSSAAHIREESEILDAALKKTGGWGCWAMSNHDAPRVASRWAGAAGPDAAQAQMLLALLLSLRGSVCLYQGEELGLPEAEVPFERLQDPYGKTFWPEFKGRDGCRTPMPWLADADDAGFGSGEVEPWLPISAAQRPLAADRQIADNASTLAQTRRLLAWRRGQAALQTGAIVFHDAPAGALLIERSLGDETIYAAFNLGTKPRRVIFPVKVAAQVGAPVAPLTPTGRTLNLPAYGVFFGSPLV
jgi:alpha-glucosidase